MGTMKERFLKSLCAISVLLCSCYQVHAQQPGGVLTVDQAVDEAIAHNLDYLAQKYDLSIAEAQIVTAKLRPNPLLTLDADHLDWLGTGFSTTPPPGQIPKKGGPAKYSVRLNFLSEGGGKTTGTHGAGCGKPRRPPSRVSRFRAGI